ncbi:MAG: molybdopterin molybdotransferase MoeA [Planctomycetota bacterium]
MRLQPGLESYAVVGTVLAGQHWPGALEPGQAVRIMTGAPCPSDCTVVQIERSNGGDTQVIFEAGALRAGLNIAWQGQDARRGDVVLDAGLRLDAGAIGAAAMAGATEVEVFVPPRVAIVTTGDEVGASGPAGIPNSNGPYLDALCAGLGVPFRAWHARDEEAELRATLQAAAAESDVVVTVGGVSMGTHDLVPMVAAELGLQELMHKVAIQPGKPVYLAGGDSGRFLLGLPGNPVSVLVGAHLFLAPLLGRFAGDWRPTWLKLPIAQPFEHRGNRRLFLPARLGDGGLWPVRWNGSGDFYSAIGGDGLIDLQPGQTLAAGECVPFLPMLCHTPGEVAASRIPQPIA